MIYVLYNDINFLVLQVNGIQLTAKVYSAAKMKVAT
jgi:hypothetical protein